LYRINKPGGVGKIVKVCVSSLGVVDSLDVKYVLDNNTDTNLEPDLVKPHTQLDRGRRSRKGRDFIKIGAAEKNPTKNPKRKSPTAKGAEEENKENQPSVNNRKKGSSGDEDKTTKKRTAQSSSSGSNSKPSKMKKKSTIFTKATVASSKTKADYKSKKHEHVSNRERSNLVATAVSREVDPVPSVIVTETVTVVTQLSPLPGGSRHAASTLAFPWKNSTNASYTKPSSEMSKTATYECHEGEAKMPLELSSAAFYGATTSLEAGKKLLTDVYQHQVCEANIYINNLVGVPQKSEPVEPPSNTSCPKKDYAQQKPPEKMAEELRAVKCVKIMKAQCLFFVRDAMHCISSLQFSLLPFSCHRTTPCTVYRRWQLFVEYFGLAMSRNGMSLQEENVLGALNDCIRADRNEAFTIDEVNRFVSRLCSEEKIMKSCGCYYEI